MGYSDDSYLSSWVSKRRHYQMQFSCWRNTLFPFITCTFLSRTGIYDMWLLPVLSGFVHFFERKFAGYVFFVNQMLVVNCFQKFRVFADWYNNGAYETQAAAVVNCFQKFRIFADWYNATAATEDTPLVVNCFQKFRILADWYNARSRIHCKH